MFGALVVFPLVWQSGAGGVVSSVLHTRVQHLQRLCLLDLFSLLQSPSLSLLLPCTRLVQPCGGCVSINQHHSYVWSLTRRCLCLCDTWYAFCMCQRVCMWW